MALEALEVRYEDTGFYVYGEYNAFVEKVVWLEMKIS